MADEDASFEIMDKALDASVNFFDTADAYGGPQSPDHIRRACEASLRCLKTEQIDLYQMHHIDRSTPWEDIWQAIEQLIRKGKVSYVGSSNSLAGTS